MAGQKTDRQKVIHLLRELGVGYTETPSRLGDSKTELQLHAQSDRNVQGYAGFFAEFTFAADGRFLELGIWE